MGNDKDVYELLGRTQLLVWRQEHFISQLNGIIEDLKAKNQQLKHDIEMLQNELNRKT